MNFIECLKKLMHDIPGPIFLIVDGHSSHTAGITKEFVQGTESRLDMFFLLPYSPERNPDEWVWKNIKHDWAGKLAARTVGELKNGIQKAFPAFSLGRRSFWCFFRDPDLRYVTDRVLAVLFPAVSGRFPSLRNGW